MADNNHLSLRKNSLFVSAGAAIRLVVSLVSIPLLVRFLGLDRYGVWVVLNSVISIAGLMELGLSTSFTNYLSIDYAHQNWSRASRTVATSFVLVTCLGALTTVCLWLAYPLVGRVLFFENSHRAETLLALEVLSWLLLLRFWQQWAMAAEAALLRYDVKSTIETASTVIMQIGVMLLALAGSQLWVLAAWSLAATAGSVIVHYLALKHLFDGHLLQLRFSGRIAKILFRFGAIQWFTNLGASLFGYADRILVNLLMGSQAAGLYSAATSIAMQINTLSAIPLRVLPPAISSAKALSQHSRIREIFIRATKTNGLLVVFTTAPILFWAPQLTNLLVGAEYVAITTDLLRILAFVYGTYSLSVASYFTAIGFGHPILNARWGTLGALFSLFLMIILTSRAGLIGAAWGNIGYALMLMVNYQIVKIIGIKYSTYLRLFLPTVIIVILWGAFSKYGDIFSPSIWARMTTFSFLGLISAVYFTGLTFIRYFFDRTKKIIQIFP